MIEVVVGAYAHDGDTRSPARTCLLRETVSTTVVGHLERVDATHHACGDHPRLRCSLRVPCQHHLETAPRHLEHEAPVVRAELIGLPRGPQHTHLAGPDRQTLASAESYEWHPPPWNEALSGLAHPDRIRAPGVRDAYPADRHDPHETLDAARVVIVRVREEHRVEMPDALACQRLPQHARFRPRVHEDRPRAVTHEDRVPLADIQHRDTEAARAGQTDVDHEEQRHRYHADSACARSRGLRPVPPQDRKGSDAYEAADDSHAAHAHRRTRQRREPTGARGDARQQRTSHTQPEVPDARDESVEERRGQPDIECEHAQRHDHDIRHGREYRDHAERRRLDRVGRSL